MPTAGKKVPGSPEWMDKFVATLNIADTEFQLGGDYVGKRYATYTNDLQVKSYFLMNLGVSGKLPFLNGGWVKKATGALTGSVASPPWRPNSARNPRNSPSPGACATRTCPR